MVSLSCLSDNFLKAALTHFFKKKTEVRTEKLPSSLKNVLKIKQNVSHSNTETTDTLTVAVKASGFSF